MDKRIHTKRSSNLTYRHYLFHFKWPLLGIIFIFIVLTLTQMNIISYVYSPDLIEENFEISFTDVIYPIDISHEKNLNQSILYYFQRKEQFKAIDDAKSIDRKEKIILPLMTNISSSNSYLILEFTKVFFRPRFCSHTKEEIFGVTCPFTNW
jgi:hypothetical protein